MSERRFYDKIVEAIKDGLLAEEFCCDDVSGVCTGMEGFSNEYLEDHAIGNKKGNQELFKKVGPDHYRCVTPSDYGAI